MIQLILKLKALTELYLCLYMMQANKDISQVPDVFKLILTGDKDKHE